MTFEWPVLLFGLLLVPLFAAFYVVAQRKRRRYPLTYSSIGLVSRAVGPRQALRRHLPAALYLLALSAMLLGMARPHATVPDPDAIGTVILVVDASRSMLSPDIAPTRIDAAKAAVRAFVLKQPSGISIGVVAFSGSAFLVMPPTPNRDNVVAAVNTLTLGTGTNIGAGLQVALETLAPGLTDPESPGTAGGGAAGGMTPPGLLPVDPDAALIVLLSDGASTTGPPPLEVAQLVAEAGIRTYTVGIGTVRGAGGGRLRQLDESTLKGIADETGGRYFSAADAGELHDIYSSIGRDHELVTKRMEVTFLAAGAGVILLLFSGLLGALWFNRLP
jgi:Ca-activated chloride channel family protein